MNRERKLIQQHTNEEQNTWHLASLGAWPQDFFGQEGILEALRRRYYGDMDILQEAQDYSVPPDTRSDYLQDEAKWPWQCETGTEPADIRLPASIGNDLADYAINEETIFHHRKV